MYPRLGKVLGLNTQVLNYTLQQAQENVKINLFPSLRIENLDLEIKILSSCYKNIIFANGEVEV
jgi:hypothetical protein